MAKTLKTRIKNRYDSLTNWSKDGVELLQGEIALVKIETEQIDKATGDVVKVPAFLMKVGENDASGKPKAFNTLPWMSALAADVYDWAKSKKATDVPVKVGNTESTLGAYLTQVNANMAAIAEVSQKVDVNSVAAAISAAISEEIEALDSTSTGSGTFVKAVTQTNGVVAVTYGTISEGELPSISTDKVYLADDDGIYLTEKLSDMDAVIAEIDEKAGHDHPYLPDTTMWAAGATQGGAAVSANKVNKKLSIKLNSGAANEFDGSSEVSINITPNAIGAVTYDSVFGDDGINEKVAANAASIADLQNFIGSGVRFIGVCGGPLEDSFDEENETFDGKPLHNGDMILDDGGSRELLWVKSGNSKGYWIQVGDESSIGALNHWRSTLNYTEVKDGAATNNKFVTKVTQTDGKIAVTYARPSAADITYSDATNNTVAKAIAANTAAAAEALEAAEHSHTAYVNQNAFSKIAVSGQTTVEAESTTDTITFAGSNVTITTDANSDKVTFSVAKADAAGETGIVTLSDSVDSNVSTTAATSKAVYTVDQKAENAQAGVAEIAANYMRVGTGDKLVQYANGTETEIIFDCGGAE